MKKPRKNKDNTRKTKETQGPWPALGGVLSLWLDCIHRVECTENPRRQTEENQGNTRKISHGPWARSVRSCKKEKKKKRNNNNNKKKNVKKLKILKNLKSKFWPLEVISRHFRPQIRIPHPKITPRVKFWGLGTQNLHPTGQFSGKLKKKNVT